MEKGISGVAAGTPSQENDSNEQQFFLRDICPFRPSTSKSNGCPNSTTWVFFSGPCSKRFQIARYRHKPHKTQAQAPAPIQQAHPNAEVHSFHLKEGVKGTGCLGKCDFQLATNRNREKNMNSRDEKLKRKEAVVESKKVSRDQEWFNMIQYDSISIKIFTTTKQLHCTSKPSTRQPCTVWRPMRFAFETWTTLLWFHIFRRTPRRCWCHAKPGMSRSPRPRVQGQLSRRHCQPHAWQEACEKSHKKCYQIKQIDPKKTLICSTHSTKSPVNKPCMQHTKGSISSTGVSPFQDFVRQGRIIVFLPCQEVKF